MLQQGVHRHHEVTPHRADQHEQDDRDPPIGHEHHGDDQQPHRDTHGKHANRALERNVFCRQNGSQRDAERNDGGQLGGSFQAEFQGQRCPREHDQAQSCAGAPEQRGHGQRNLAERVAPQQPKAVPEVLHDEHRIAFLQLVVNGNPGDVQVDGCRDGIQQQDDDNCQFGRRIDAGFDQRQVDARENVGGELGADHNAAEDGPEDDCGHRQTFHPAVGEHQFLVREVFGQDAVLGRRIHRGADADETVGQQRVRAHQHGDAAQQLDCVGHEHHATFGQGVGERAHEWRQHNVGENEKLLQHGRLPSLRMQARQQCNRGEQQGVVGKGREKLGCQDGVEPAVHGVRAGRSSESGFFALTIIASSTGGFIPH